MIKLSNGAREYLDRYLKQIRACLRGCRTVDANEVERNIMEHVEGEFEGATATVSFEELDAVLKRLGSARQWVPDEELPWWRRAILQLRTGPEDWRLAYISFGLLLLGFLFFIHSPLFVAVAAGSFIISRAALSVAGDRDELGAQKWLIYPSLILVYLGIAFSLLFGQIFLAAPLADELWDSGIVRKFAHMGSAVFVVSFTATVTALWWIIMGIVFCKWPGLVQKTFKPFADWFNRKWAAVLTCVGLGLLVLTLAVVGYLRFAVFSAL